MARRRIPRMPVEELIDHPRALALPAAGYGMLVRLLLHYWQTECKAVVEQEDEQRGISRAQRATWIRWRGEIIGIYREIAPKMKLALEQRNAQFEALRSLGDRGKATQRASRLIVAEKTAPALAANQLSGATKRKLAAKLEQDAAAANARTIDNPLSSLPSSAPDNLIGSTFTDT